MNSAIPVQARKANLKQQLDEQVGLRVPVNPFSAMSFNLVVYEKLFYKIRYTVDCEAARRVSTTLRQVLTKFSEFSVFTEKFRARMAQERRSPTRSTHSISGFALLQAHFLFPKYIAGGI